jgi:ribose transport system ATP-binding protein
MTTEGTPPPLVEARGLSKSFGGALVLRGVDVKVRRGTLHGLIGPNGAGKSTFLKILDGVLPADAGSVVIRGRAGPVGTVGVVHQDLGLADALTIRENLCLGVHARRRSRLLIDHSRERAATIDQLAEVGLTVDPDTPVGELPLGAKALVAVAQLFSGDHDVLVLDEVTAALPRRDSSWLLGAVREFTRRGGAAIVVSHRLQEIATHCDDITLLKDGEVAYCGATPALDEIHRRFIGGDRFARREPSTSAEPTSPVLELRSAAAPGVGPVDLDVHAGEVVALVGALSSNVYAIAHLAAGRLAAVSGSRRLHAWRRQAGPQAVGFLAEDRRELGVFPDLEVSANVAIGSLATLARGGVVDRRREAVAVDHSTADLGVTPRDPSMLMSQLSGGNQQRALLARASLVDHALYVLCEPTHGVDVTTRVAIYRFIERVRDAGAAVVVATIDADDAMAVADRIGLVEDGRLIEIARRDALSAEVILERVS